MVTIKDEPMDFDYEDIEIISETTNNFEQSVSIIFFHKIIVTKKTSLCKYCLFFSIHQFKQWKTMITVETNLIVKKCKM